MKKHPYITYAFIFLVFTPNFFFAQSNRTLRIQADMAMKQKDWYSAAVLYGKFVRRDSTIWKVNYKYADASRLNFDLDIALNWYNKVIAFDNGKKFPMAFYWKAEILQYKANYKEAKKWFTKFAKSRRVKGEKYKYYTTKAAIQADACDLAQALIANPSSFQVAHLDTSINSKVSEYAAFEKDSTLYFSSLRKTPKKYADDDEPPLLNKIYTSPTKMGKWQKVKSLDTNINATYMHNANICFTDDYKHMVISRCNNKNASEYTCELYESNFERNKWQPAKKMGEPINLKGTSSSMPSFGKMNDSTFLFFTSTRPTGGHGGYDIWYAYRYSDGAFDEPRNAGPKVNTPDDDITPWYVNDQNILYFSSTYHKGLGGYDIYRSSFEKGAFGEPSNAGYPVNSSYNDIYPSVNKEGTFAYLSSNRIGSYFEHKLNCCNDIYRYPLEPKAPPPAIDTVGILKGQMKVLVPLTLYFHNDEPDAKTKAITTKKNYKKAYEDYTVLKPQYLTEYSANLEKDEKLAAQDRIEDFFADSVDFGMSELNKFALLLEQVLAKNEKVEIIMKGYCSPLASTDYNVNLAKRRISSLRNYFNEYKGGIFLKYVDNKNEAEGRITYKDVDIGELPVSRVSDDLKDKKNSVYSPFAARERKIQIIAVSFGEKGPSQDLTPQE